MYVEVYVKGKIVDVVEITVLAGRLEVITMVCGGPAGTVDMVVIVSPASNLISQDHK